MAQQRQWQSARVQRFLLHAATEDPVSAVVERAARLVESLAGPPFDLDAVPVRAALQVKTIRYVRKLAAEGRMFWDDNGYAIEINAARTPTRQRFTLAHELAHIFFSEPGEIDTFQRQGHAAELLHAPDAEEELLCDAAAAEMLMPKRAFQRRAWEYGPSAQAIQVLASEFAVSLAAAARRFAQLDLWRCHIALWSLNSAGLPVCDWGVRSGYSRFSIPVGQTAPPGSVVARAVQKGAGICTGRSDMGFTDDTGERIGPVFGQALFLTGWKRVLSVAVFEKDASILCARMATRMQQQRIREQVRDAALGQQASLRFFGRRHSADGE